MQYAIGSTGSNVVIPTEWVQLSETLKGYPEGARVWALRIIAIFNDSAAQMVSNLLNLAKPLVPSGSYDNARKQIVDLLGSAMCTVEEKQAIVAVWRQMDAAGFSQAEDSAPIGVRMILRGGR